MIVMIISKNFYSKQNSCFFFDDSSECDRKVFNSESTCSVRYRDNGSQNDDEIQLNSNVQSPGKKRTGRSFNTSSYSKCLSQLLNMLTFSSVSKWTLMAISV